MKKFSPFLLVIVVLVLALAALGVGYGLWYENLTLEGTVSTGTVDVNWSGPNNVLEYVHVNSLKTLESDLDPSKNVADCTAALDPNDANLMTIEVTGAYPSYECDFDFDIDSTGTVPVHIDTNEALSEAAPSWVDFSCTAPDGADLTWPIDGFQLHQGEKILCSVAIHFTNADGVGQGLTGANAITFGYAIQGHQYNEAASFD